LIKHSEQTLFIRFHSANRINQKRPLTASLYSYVTAPKRTPYFSTSRIRDDPKSTAQQLSTAQLQWRQYSRAALDAAKRRPATKTVLQMERKTAKSWSPRLSLAVG